MKLLTLLFCVTIGFPVLSQYWGHNTESAFTNEAMDVETDAAGNSYITGYITGETAFGTQIVQLSAAGNGDIFVAKYAPSGQLLWIKQFGGNFSDRAYDLAIGPDQHPVITGQFFGQVTFGATTLSSAASSKDIFLLKLDPSGNVVWARKEGGNLAENAYGVAVDAQNSVILTGQFQGSASIAGQLFTSMTDPVTFQAGFDLFVAKYSSAGVPLWVQTGAAEYEDRGLAVYTDAQNNIFMTGQFSDTLTFAGQTFPNTAYNVGFLAKLSPTGSYQWLHTLRAGMVMPYDLEVNNVGEVIVIGDFLGNMLYNDASGSHPVTNPFTRQIFVLKTDNNGNYAWNKTYGSESEVAARSVSVDAQKEIYVTGWFQCAFTELQGSDDGFWNSAGFHDPYLIRVSDNGNAVYEKQLGGKKDDEGHGVAILPGGTPVICGAYTRDLHIPASGLVSYTVSGDHFNLDYPVGGGQGVMLHGDDSRNAFLLKAVDAQIPDYNYFYAHHPDSLHGFLVDSTLQATDTVHFCENGILSYFTLTDAVSGPDYNFTWNTGFSSTSPGLSITTSGAYSVHVERIDGCVDHRDTIVAEIHQFPNMPLLSDSLGIADSIPPAYPSYTFCNPDSVAIWISFLDPTANTAILFGLDTLYSNDSLPHYYSDGGVYNVTVWTPYCVRQSPFIIIPEYPVPYDTIAPVMAIATGDSAVVCINDGLHVWLYDAFVFPNGSDTVINQPLLAADWSTVPSVMQIPHSYSATFFPAASGWLTIDWEGWIGFMNTCDTQMVYYHVLDSFYVTVLPAPTGSPSIQCDNLLCPNGSVYLTVSPTYNGLHWSGPGIVWQSSGGDSIQATVSGSYTYSGIITDTITGCHSGPISAQFTLQEKVPSGITANPPDGVICPNDSVYMWLPATYLSYQWIGPDGDTLSATDDLYGTQQGLYYCHVTDDENCSLTTPHFELREFATPYLWAEPGNAICSNEPVTISVVYFGDAQIQWEAPLSGSGDTVTVMQPGTYYCSMQQCGITIMDSIVIVDGSFALSITQSDSLLCFGETAVLTAPPGLGTYEWSNGSAGTDQLNVTAAGAYWVTAMNAYGCEAVSDTVYIALSEGSVPPDIGDVAVCPGSDVVLTSSISYTTNWFSASDTTLLGTGLTFSLSNLTSDTTLLAAYENAECPPAYAYISITLTDSLPPFDILGDSLLCPGETTVFTNSLTGFTQTWLHDGTVLGNGNNITVDQSVFTNVPIISLVVSNSCFSDTIHETVLTSIPQTVSLPEDSLIVCAYSATELELNEDVDTTWWQGNFGTFTGNTLTVESAFGDGWIYVSAVDLNGCTTNTDSLYLTVSTLAYSLWSEFGNACQGDSVSFGITTSADSLTWTTPNGLTDTTLFSFPVDAANGGWYFVTQWDAVGCLYEDSLFVPVNTIPVFDLGTDTVLCINDVYTYYFPDDTNAFSWTGYGQTSSFPVMAGQWAILTATSPQGCIYTDTLYVEAVDCDGPLPNVITPNGDGINDFFFIDDALANPENHLVILNRWGDVIVDVTRYTNDFDGRNLSDGVYYYTFYPDPANKPEIKKQGFLEIRH